MEKTHSLILKSETDIGTARRLASNFATQLGFETGTIAKIALIVTEAVSNVFKHTQQEGELILQSKQMNDCQDFEIFVLDKGPGMYNVAVCLVDGYSTAGTPGTGLGAIKRLATNFDIYSTNKYGTIIWAKLEEKQKGQEADPLKMASSLSSMLELGALCVPIKGEELSGDAWASCALNSHTQVIMMVDGLGHGPEAHAVAMRATEIFYETAHQSLPQILMAQDKALRKSRGAAIAIAKIDLLTQEISYVGVGNISSQIISTKNHHGLLSLNGIVGYQMRNIKELTYPFPEEAILVMYSDGLISHWDETIFPGLLNKNPAIIAGLLYRDFKRGRDDTAVLVIKKL